MAEGLVQLAPFHPVIPAEVAGGGEAGQKGIVSGELHPFAGPITDRSGKQVVGAGQMIADADIHAMNWFVNGIEGDLPA